MEIGQEITYKNEVSIVYDICKPCKKLWTKNENSAFRFKLDRWGSLVLLEKQENGKQENVIT